MIDKSSIKVGDKAIITTDNWFYAPDGRQYRAVFGTIKAVRSAEETLGIVPNAKSTNWYVEIGNMIIAGCQIHYVLKTDTCNIEDCFNWEYIEGEVRYYKSPSNIYKTVWLPTTVVAGDYCSGQFTCSHFDNEGGHPSCGLDMGDLKYDAEGKCPKPKKCLELKEV